MLKNTLINRIAIKKVATALKDLNTQVMYVGGAIVSIYIDDPTADDVRPTKDIDISTQILSLGELEQLRLKLIERGFKQSWEDEVICRFRIEDIKVDVMGTTPIGWAPANPWFESGFAKKQLVKVEDADIYILPLSYYLCTKFSAFYDRGATDPRTSKDFEDVVYLLNYTSNIKEQIISAPSDVQTYLKNAFKEILDKDTLKEAILCNLFHENQMIRYEKIIQTLKEIVL